MRNIKVAPSIFASNFLKLEEEIKKLETLEVDYIHYDIMDNHFVPNISFGPLITKQISSSTKIPGDVHLMIDLTEEKITPFLIDNIEFITIHIEAPGFSKKLLKFIKENNKKVGISIKPKTSPQNIIPFLDIVDMVLVMTVEPGFSGQKLIPETIKKVGEVRKIIDNYNKNILLEVDGGVNLNNIPTLIEEGVDILVIGSFFFTDNNGKRVMEYLRSRVF